MELSALRAQQARRRNLLTLAVACAVVLALAGLTSCGPSDADIAGTPRSGEADRVAEVRVAAASKPVLVDGDAFHNITTTTMPPTTTTAAPTTVPVTTTVAAPAAPSGRLGDPYYIETWYALRQCEAPDWSGGWQANTGNGYYGGLQFALGSWRAVGGTGYPHEHSPAEQIRRGQMLWEMQGWGAWPSCSRKLGFR